jgi:hypothetical protein
MKGKEAVRLAAGLALFFAGWGLAGIEARMKDRPDLFTDEVRRKLSGVRRNLAIIERDGSAGAHNLDYALEIMALASRRLKEIGAATAPAGLGGQ